MTDIPSQRQASILKVAPTLHIKVSDRYSVSRIRKYPENCTNSSINAFLLRVDNGWIHLSKKLECNLFPSHVLSFYVIKYQLYILVDL